MSCHGKTHDAETEESDFGHVCYLGVLPATLNRPGSILGEAAARFDSRTGQRGRWRLHHKPCITEGNAFVWRAGLGL
jgi:hypothetical protein